MMWARVDATRPNCGGGCALIGLTPKRRSVMAPGDGERPRRTLGARLTLLGIGLVVALYAVTILVQLNQR